MALGTLATYAERRSRHCHREMSKARSHTASGLTRSVLLTGREPGRASCQKSTTSSPPLSVKVLDSV